MIEEGYDVYFVYPDFLNQINDPMMKKFVVSMFVWFAEPYRYDIVQRTKVGILRAKLQGKHIGLVDQGRRSIGRNSVSTSGKD